MTACRPSKAAAKFKAWPHPLHIIHRTAENLLSQLLAVFARRDRDDRIRVHVIHKLCRDETVQWRVNGAGARIEIERRVIVSGHHVVFRL